ncbi:MAG: hypothetical protein QOE40_1450 [Actinomycetota bacterium]|jgi:hypothetical protein|nr:hypothetical protein [Actinomycetota bacterium]
MRTKFTFLAGFATGYVLGSKAGRARYEQIREAARAFASNPAVQSTANQLQHQATDALATAKDKASETLGDKWQDKKPGWMSHGAGAHSAGGTTTTSTSTGVAGSNGQV